MKTTATLTDILLESPSAALVFERNNLDYCCGGKRTLDDACTQAGLDTQKVLQELFENTSVVNSVSFRPSMWDTAMLINYIEQNHHRYLRVALPAIKSSIHRVATKHGEKYPETIAIAELIDDLDVELREHMDEEERGVFAKQGTTLDPIDVRNEIALHEADHNSVGKKLLRLKAITNGFVPPMNACTSHRASYRMIQEFVHDTMQHVFLENSLLFPKLLVEADSNLSSTTV